MTCFAETRLRVFDRENMCTRYITIPPNTIVIDNSIMTSEKEALANFTVLHEGGHFCMHREVYEDGLRRQQPPEFCSRKRYGNSRKKLRSQKDFREHQADVFAAAVALPADTLVPCARQMIQVKFVGENGAECLDKLASKKYDKYFEGDHVDKIEIPKDHYKEIKSDRLIENRIENLEKQLSRVKENGNQEAAQKIEAKIDRYNKIDEMLEQSNTSTDEAMFARQHPEAYTRLQFAHQAGLESSIGAAGITAAISTVDNIRAVTKGEMTPLEAFGDVAKDTGAAAALGYGTGFVSTTIAQSMSSSSHQLIQSVGNAGIPAAAISFGIASYDSISDYAMGNIGGRELAYDLGGNALGVAGSILGSGLATAAVGSFVPGIGTVGGFAIGTVGGMVGYAVSTEAYKTAVVYGSEGASVLADKAKSFASGTLDQVRAEAPEKAEAVRTSINNFAAAHSLPFQLG